MGMGMESALLIQVKKAQGETNSRLDALLREQIRTNDLLARLVGDLTGTTSANPTPDVSPYVADLPRPLGGRNLSSEDIASLPRIFGKKRK